MRATTCCERDSFSLPTRPLLYRFAIYLPHKYPGIEECGSQRFSGLRRGSAIFSMLYDWMIPYETEETQYIGLDNRHSLHRHRVSKSLDTTTLPCG
jgi:hypothetical protein